MKRHPWLTNTHRVHRSTLNRWFAQADREAKAEGLTGVCHICLRKCNYRRGWLELRAAKAYKFIPLRYPLCKDCVGMLRRFVAELQYELRNGGMSPDE